MNPQPLNMPYTADQILAGVSHGVYVTDLERRIVYWNEAAEKITGWRAAEVLGRSCKDNILRHTDKEGRELCGKESCPLYRAMVTGSGSIAPSLVFARKREGGRLPVQVSVSPIFNGLGTVIGGVEVFQDLSHRMRDLERARQIQALSMTMPANDDPRLRWAFHYAPHDIVGGDYSSVERLDRDRYAFLIADVMGHGVAAALYAMHLHSLWESNRGLLEQPAIFMAALNRNLCQLVRDGESFATCLFGLIDLETRTVALCGAGSPPLLLAREKEIRQIKTTGLPLGMMPDTEYEASRISFCPGDGLLFFTDGAIEIADSRGTMLGSDGLANLVHAHGFPDSEEKMLQLAEKILLFSNGIRLPDDLTMLGVRFPTEP
ncbi:SpoIIE family protein phosphatase [Thiovibrio frasassiensis]|uniref:SpoIIE family protein phosphatase n=1 Tax=Thiovibrio frasassiensis TaxID=2984131 RepID=A0A9X4MEW4_9BACT|nr:SpoIIE family protein phosphatase [Thiovibrio frasassiensis]MDG4476279.1 SpoIIE family protein phosphatase [Thiovibrio frasassiensis]